MEKDMNFLGVSGVEETLQDDAKLTIETLHRAGIKVWIFSGDRVENVANIALSSGVKGSKNELYYITNIINKSDILFRLSQF